MFPYLWDAGQRMIDGWGPQALSAACLPRARRIRRPSITSGAFKEDSPVMIDQCLFGVSWCKAPKDSYRQFSLRSQVHFGNTGFRIKQELSFVLAKKKRRRASSAKQRRYSQLQTKHLVGSILGPLLIVTMFPFGTEAAALLRTSPEDAMRKNSKENQRWESKRACHNYRDYLVRSLGTPDGLRAAAEFIRSASALCIMWWLVLSGERPFPETIIRIIAAVAISKALFKAEWYEHRQYRG
jgi:hypothetical protein